MAKPKPISATAVRCHDIIARSTLRQVRTQEKWLSDVILTSNLAGLGTVCESVIVVPFLPSQRKTSRTRNAWITIWTASEA